MNSDHVFAVIKGCMRKRKYETREEAARTGQHVFKCLCCGRWHRSGPLVRLRNPVIPPDFKL